MKKIKMKNKSSVQAIANAMKKKEKFVIVTDDKDFKPLGYDRHSAEFWVSTCGGGVMMAIGVVPSF